MVGRGAEASDEGVEAVDNKGDETRPREGVDKPCDGVQKNVSDGTNMCEENETNNQGIGCDQDEIFVGTPGIQPIVDIGHACVKTK